MDKGRLGSPQTERGTRMKRYLLLVLGVLAVSAFAFAASASAQSGHFVGTPTCTDIGTQVSCDGKVAGLGGTTFSLRVSAQALGTSRAEIRVATSPRVSRLLRPCRGPLVRSLRRGMASSASAT